MRPNHYLRCVSVAVLTLTLFVPGLLAQQQYGALHVRAVDETKAVIPGAEVDLTSPALIRPITGTTDAQGLFVITTLPPGIYTITVRSAGFMTTVTEDVTVEVGRTFAVEMVCKIGAITETVIVESTEIIDVVSSESAAVFTGDILTDTAGGRDFTDYASLVPSVNQEALSGGISVDGSSGAENVFYVDGIDTTSMYTGLNNQNLRTETVEQFQLKTAGYAAEFGGAMGGVMSVRTKSGTNDFHGSFLWYYSGSFLTTKPRQRLRLDPAQAIDVAEYFQDSEDGSNRNEVGITLGGPILRDKLYFFGAYLPQWTSFTRDIVFTSGESGIFRQDQQVKHATLKFDYQPADPVKFFVSYATDWNRWKGGLPSRDGTSNPAFEWSRQGFEFPGTTVSGGGTFTVSPNFLIDARWGLNGIATDQFLGPAQVRHRFIQSPGLVGFATTDPLYRPRGFSTIGHADSFNTTQDYQKKSTYKLDGSYLVNAGGQHNLRFGW